MSVFFEARPHWGHPASFMQQSTPANAEDQSNDDNAERPGPRRGGPHHRGHRGGPHGGPRGHRGDPFGMRGGHFHHHGHRGFEHGHGPGPREDEPFGPMRWGRGGMFGHRGGHHHPYHGFHHRGHHRGGRGGVRVVPIPLGEPATGFDFLSRFASEMGNGFQDFLTGSREANDDNRTQVDFEPRADVFNTLNEYVIHVSLPGAQKPDISVEYDAQKSTVRIAGVVHRPEFSEELNAAMVWNERRREVGMFERSFKFIPSGSEAVDVDGENITAKMVDGVLIVRLSKTQQQEQEEKQNKKIVINEDDDLYDADPVEKEQEVDHEEHNTEDIAANEKHASVVEVQDDMDSMHITSDTEAGDLLEEVDKVIYTPSHLSEEDAEEAAEYVKVDVK